MKKKLTAAEKRHQKFSKNFANYYGQVFKNIEIKSGVIFGGYQHFVNPLPKDLLGGFYPIPKNLCDMVKKITDEQKIVIVKSVIMNGAKCKLGNPVNGPVSVYLQGFYSKFGRFPRLDGSDKIKLIFNAGYVFRLVPYYDGYAIESWIKWVWDVKGK